MIVIVNQKGNGIRCTPNGGSQNQTLEQDFEKTNKLANVRKMRDKGVLNHALLGTFHTKLKG
jgi:hypothetical protein